MGNSHFVLQCGPHNLKAIARGPGPDVVLRNDLFMLFDAIPEEEHMLEKE